MNILIITENFYPLKEPTAKIVERLINNKCFENSRFIIVSKGESKKLIHYSPSVINHQINDYYSFNDKNTFDKIITFCYKFISRIYAMFFPRDLLDTHRLYKRAKKILSNNNIGCVIAVSGWFSAQRAANLISKKFKVPFYSWYTDPFLFNLSRQKFTLHKLIKIETKWLANTSAVFLPHNYYLKYRSIPNYYQDKFVEVELPCFFSSEELQIIHRQKVESIILHTGSFFSEIRNPQKLFELANKLEEFESIKFVCLGNLDKKLRLLYRNNIPAKFIFSPRKTGNELLEEIGKAALLVLVDNSQGIQIPSKTFEYISTGKPILFLYSSPDSETLKILRRYPKCFFIHRDDTINVDVVNKILSIIRNVEQPLDMEEIEKIFPNMILDNIFKSICSNLLAK